MPRVRTGPVIGLIIQVVVLAGLAATAGLDTLGWLVGLAYGAVVCAVLDAGLQRADRPVLGPADWVTIVRAGLTGGVAAMVASGGSGVALVVVASVALALDWVDGQVARRTGTVSELGARFDMEIDASLLVILSLFVAQDFGAWVLVLGLMRYAFVAAMWVLPWMRGTLPPRYWRKVVAATQGIVLVAAASGVLPRPLAMAALVWALVLLVESFGRDILWLWQHRPALVAVRSRT